jgi:hypothetical protein
MILRGRSCPGIAIRVLRTSITVAHPEAAALRLMSQESAQWHPRSRSFPVSTNVAEGTQSLILYVAPSPLDPGEQRGGLKLAHLHFSPAEPMQRPGRSRVFGSLAFAGPDATTKLVATGLPALWGHRRIKACPKRAHSDSDPLSGPERMTRVLVVGWSQITGPNAAHPLGRTF